MTTYYYMPLPELPETLLSYCSYHNYPLSLKKKYIVSQVLAMRDDTDIDLLVNKTARYSNSISRSSIYLVLQWMLDHKLVKKTNTEDNAKIFYNLNDEKLNSLSLFYKETSAIFPGQQRNFA